MKHLLVALVGAGMLGSIVARGECRSGLADQIAGVHIAASSALAALVDFGIRNGVCLAVESPGLDLLQKPVEVSATNPSVSYVIESLLGGAPYRVSEQSGVIVVRNLETMSRQTLLDTILPDFVTKRKQSLGSAEWILMGSLMLFEDRTASGIAGTYSDRVPDDVVGPFDEHGQSVRDLLTLLVRQSSGAAWVSGRCLPPAQGRACWTILDYHDDHTALDGFLKERTRELLREWRAK